MLFKIDVIDQKAQPVLYIRTKTTMRDLPKIINESYHKIYEYLKEMNENPIDVPYTAYHSLDTNDLDVEMGFPVSRPLSEKNEIKSGEIPRGRYVTCLYKGPYSQMEQPYNEIFRWIEENGYEKTGVYYEYYFNSPTEVPESELITRIAIPVK